MNRKFKVNALTIFAVTGETLSGTKSRYIIICEKDKDHPAFEDVKKLVESLLQESFHYKLARDLHQLGIAKALFHPRREEYIRKERNLKEWCSVISSWSPLCNVQIKNGK